MIKLIRDKDEWCAAVKAAIHSDFYHTYDYHHLSRKEDESPILIEYKEGDKSIALPLLIRNIPDTEFKDATSVYGYPGPIGVHLEDGFDNKKFREELIQLFNWNKIISVFSRLNPFIPQQSEILKGMGDISSPGKVVYIDLSKSPDQHWGEYSRRLKTYINKSRREYSIHSATTRSEVLQFIEMYYGNMKRVNAHENYFFEEDYFFDLLKSKDFQAEIKLASKRSDGEIVGGALFIKKKRIVQYHLSGAKDSTLKLNPIKMLIDEMRLEATHEGYKSFNLGGGVGNQEDSLFRFKSSYSKEYKDFNLWKFVVNTEAYDELVTKFKSGVCQKFVKNCNDFFPCYRCDK